MRAAVLCSGPSLLRTATADAISGALVIAVNAAIYHQPGGRVADWWCCMDACAWDMFSSPALLSGGAPRLGYAGRVHPLECEPIAGRRLRDLRGELASMGSQFATYTAPAALWFAFAEGAKTIELYGCDLAGSGDFRGYDPDQAGYRTPGRWEEEAGHLLRAMDLLQARGASIQRIA